VQQDMDAKAVLTALSNEASRTFKALTSPELRRQLAVQMRAGLPPDIPDSLIADLVTGTVLPRGTVFEHLRKSKRQGSREINAMIASGWLASDSPKGPVRAAVPTNVLVQFIEP